MADLENHRLNIYGQPHGFQGQPYDSRLTTWFKVNHELKLAHSTNIWLKRLHISYAVMNIITSLCWIILVPEILWTLCTVQCTVPLLTVLSYYVAEPKWAFSHFERSVSQWVNTTTTYTYYTHLHLITTRDKYLIDLQKT